MHTRTRLANRTATRQPSPTPSFDSPTAESFSNNVFTIKEQQAVLDQNDFTELQATLREGRELSTELADAVAAGMLEWATSQGATHFTH